MIEVHSHILPGIDDGALNMAVSTSMLSEYINQGVKKIICTPHFYSKNYQSLASLDSYIEFRQKQYHLLSSYAAIHHPEAELYLGAEITISADFLNILKKYGRSKMLTLANSDFLLIELPHYLSGGIKLLSRVLFEIQMQGYIPILAHPERAMISEGIFETLLEWYVQGKVMIQINASSLINDPRISPDRQARYSKRRKYAKMLLEANIVDFISSDAHDDNERPPQNYLARYEVSREYGQSIANNLFSLNAKKILNNYII